MLRLVLILVCASACASGQRGARPCDPLPADYSSYDGLYQDCNVDVRARIVSRPMPDFSRLQPLATSAAGCYSADFTLVVDEKGMPVPRSIKLDHTNSQTYAQAISDVVGGLRFEPAKKDGMPVRQLYEYKAKMRYRMVSGSTTGSRRPPPC